MKDEGQSFIFDFNSNMDTANQVSSKKRSLHASLKNQSLGEKIKDWNMTE